MKSDKDSTPHQPGCGRAMHPGGQPYVPGRLTGILIRIYADGYGFIRVAVFDPAADDKRGRYSERRPENGAPFEYFVRIESLRDRSLWVEGTPVAFTPGHLTAAQLARAAAQNRCPSPPAWDVGPPPGVHVAAAPRKARNAARACIPPQAKEP